MVSGFITCAPFQYRKASLLTRTSTARTRQRPIFRTRPRATPAACFDPYKELGVSRDADAAAIKRAYRKAALERHPDVSEAPDAQESFQRAQDAYRMLNDRTARAAYDRASRRSSSSYTSSGSSSYGDDGAAAREYARKWRQANPMPEDLNDDLGSVLSDLFGGMRDAAAGKGPSVLNDVMDFLERGAGISNGERTSSSGNTNDLDQILKSKSEDVLEAELRECDRAEKEAVSRARGAEEEVKKLESRKGEWERRAKNSIGSARIAATEMVDEVERQRARLSKRAKMFEEAAEATRAHRERVKNRLIELRNGDGGVGVGSESNTTSSSTSTSSSSSYRRSSNRREAVDEELDRMKREMGL